MTEQEKRLHRCCFAGHRPEGILLSESHPTWVCLSYSPVMGTWRPLAGTTPYIGVEGQISCQPELKVEVTILADRFVETMEAIKRVHPYEEPVINAIPLWETGFSDRELKS